MGLAVQPTFELIPTTGSSGPASRPGSQGVGKAEAQASQGTERTPTQQVDFVGVWRAPAKRKLARMLVRVRYPFVNRESSAVQLTSKGTWYLHELRARESGETCLSYVLATRGCLGD